MADPNDSRIGGLGLSVGADGVIVCTSGACYLPGTFRIGIDTPLTLSPSGLAPNSWLHTYIGNDSNGVPVLWGSATPPQVTYQGFARTMAGDPTKRYLGSVRVNAAGTLNQILTVSVGSTCKVVMYAPTGIAGPDATLFTGLIAQSTTVASLSAGVPPTARLCTLEVDNTAGIAFYLSNPDKGAINTSSNFLHLVRGLTGTPVEMILDASQQFSYMYGAGLSLGGSATIRINSYVYDR